MLKPSLGASINPSFVWESNLPNLLPWRIFASLHSSNPLWVLKYMPICTSLLYNPSFVNLLSARGRATLCYISYTLLIVLRTHSSFHCNSPEFARQILLDRLQKRRVSVCRVGKLTTQKVVVESQVSQNACQCSAPHNPFHVSNAAHQNINGHPYKKLSNRLSLQEMYLGFRRVLRSRQLMCF